MVVLVEQLRIVFDAVGDFVCVANDRAFVFLDVALCHIDRIAERALHPRREPLLHALVDDHGSETRNQNGGHDGDDSELPHQPDVQPRASGASLRPQSHQAPGDHCPESADQDHVDQDQPEQAGVARPIGHDAGHRCIGEQTGDHRQYADSNSEERRTRQHVS